jgi:hypothetical protein
VCAQQARRRFGSRNSLASLRECGNFLTQADGTDPVTMTALGHVVRVLAQASKGNNHNLKWTPDLSLELLLKRRVVAQM